MKQEIRARIEQIRQGIVPEGYKKTKSGILPKDWSVRTIAECLERVEHPVEVQANEMYTQIGIRSHGKGLFYKEPVTGDSLGNKSVFWIEPNCFILNIVFAWEQAIGKTTQAEAGMIGSHRFPMYRPINGSIDIDYLISYLLTKRGTDILEAASPGGAGRNRTLGQDRFMKSRIVLPPLDEQRKIAEILTTQDRAIELQGRKIEELKRYKKGCLERMFPRNGQKVPEKRFPGFTGDWEQRKLGELCAKFKSGDFISAEEICLAGNYPVYGGNGLRGYTNRYNHDGDFALIGRQGALCGNMNYSSGKAYFTEHAVAVQANGMNDTRFLFYCFSNMNLGQFSGQSAQPGLAVSKLIELTTSVPGKAEQEKISSTLTFLDNLITLHQRKLEEMKKLKKALMQLLLTGIVRVQP